MTDNSPAIHRWVRAAKTSQSPGRGERKHPFKRTDRTISFVPGGTGSHHILNPTDESDFSEEGLFRQNLLCEAEIEFVIVKPRDAGIYPFVLEALG
jgi:hypothetical protein